MKRLLFAMIAVTFMIGAPHYTLHGKIKEHPCCLPAKDDPTRTGACKTLPTWECKRRGGTVVEDCGECPP